MIISWRGYGGLLLAGSIFAILIITEVCLFLLGKKSKENKKLIWVSVGIVLGLWGMVMYAVIGLSHDVAQAGQFGDMFGAVNSLFTGLAFAGLIITIYLQRQQMALQREEIEQQRKSDAIQHFENNFYNLLNIFKAKQSEICLPPNTMNNPQTLKGGEVFYETMNFWFNGSRLMPFTSANEVLGQRFRIAIRFFYSYLIYFFNILELIEKEESLDYSQKKKYSKILRSFLSGYEQIVITFILDIDAQVTGGQFTIGRLLIEKYTMMNQLYSDNGFLQDDLFFENFYQKRAFQEDGFFSVNHYSEIIAKCNETISFFPLENFVKQVRFPPKAGQLA